MPRTTGSKVEYHAERIDHLMRLYHAYITGPRKISRTELYAYIAAQPAPRFWVSSKRALGVVSRIIRGHWPAGMRATKVRMYEEILRRVYDRMSKHPEMSLRDAVESVVESPAPSSYLEPGSTMTMVYANKKRWYAARREKRRKD